MSSPDSLASQPLACLAQIISQSLPPLYSLAPSLQAFAILTGTGTVQIYSMAMPMVLRLLPVVALADLDEQVAADINDFRRALPRPDDTILVIEASGSCVWTSAEMDLDTTAARTDAVNLCSTLANALGHRHTNESNDDVEMDKG